VRGSAPMHAGQDVFSAVDAEQACGVVVQAATEPSTGAWVGIEARGTAGNGTARWSITLKSRSITRVAPVGKPYCRSRPSTYPEPTRCHRPHVACTWKTGDH
ncbi:MAG: hypothetical protein EBV53_02330, partial [Proteobacteria bacterium]|nr:hypothetical protein [Pseudomonadota bacterium]